MPASGERVREKLATPEDENLWLITGRTAVGRRVRVPTWIGNAYGDGGMPSFLCVIRRKFDPPTSSSVPPLITGLINTSAWLICINVIMGVVEAPGVAPERGGVIVRDRGPAVRRRGVGRNVSYLRALYC